MGRQNSTDSAVPRSKPPQVVVSEDVHKYLRIRAAEENITIGRVVANLVRDAQERTDSEMVANG